MISSLYRPIAAKGHNLVIKPSIKLEKLLCDEYIHSLRRALSPRLPPNQVEEMVNRALSYRQSVEKLLSVKPERENLYVKLRVLDDNMGDSQMVRNENIELQRKFQSLIDLEDTLEKELVPFYLNLPNLHIPDEASENDEIIKIFHEPWSFSFKIQSSVKLSYINFGHHSTIIGPSSKYTIGAGVQAQRKLLKFTTDFLSSHAFISVNGLDIVKSALLEACQGSRGSNFLVDPSRILNVESDTHNQKHHLVGNGSLESIMGLLSQKSLPSKSLPLKLMAIGSKYKETLEQVNGVHFVIWLNGDNDHVAKDEMNSILNAWCEFYSNLELPSKLVRKGSKFLNKNEADKYEIQIWLPYSNCWRTCSEISYHDYYTPQRIGKENILIEGSFIDLDLLLSSIMENYQKEDGSFSIPIVLERGNQEQEKARDNEEKNDAK